MKVDARIKQQSAARRSAGARSPLGGPHKLWRLLLVAAVIGLAGCSGEATPATQVSATEAHLNATGGCENSDGNGCWVYMQYRRHGASTWTNLFTQGYSAPSHIVAAFAEFPFYFNVSNLAPETEYEYQVCGKEDNYSPAGVGTPPYGRASGYFCVGPEHQLEQAQSFVTTAAAPSCNLTTPGNGQQVSGTIALDAEAQNAVSVEYYLNGVDLGAAYKGAYGWLYSSEDGRSWGWNSASVSNGSYSLTCVATAADGRKYTSPANNITVQNATGCDVVTPSEGQSLSGLAAIAATAPEATSGVDFYLHTSAHDDFLLSKGYKTIFGWLPKTPSGAYGWNTAMYGNGSVRISCVATESSGTTLSSPTVNVSLSNSHDVNVYGANGSFLSASCGSYPSVCIGGINALGATFPTAAGLIEADNWNGNPVSSWQNSTGGMAWSSAVDPGSGAVFTGYIPQTGRELTKTSWRMNVNVFEPEAQTDSLLSIPTSTGYTGDVKDALGYGGADTSSLISVPDSESASGNAIMFAAAAPYTWAKWDIGTYGQYPEFGKIIQVKEGTGLQWRVDQAASMTGDQIVESSPDAKLIDPNTLLSYGEESCPLEHDALKNGVSGASIHECGDITAIARLPYSGDIVASLYLANAIAVFDSNGHLLAAWKYPEVPAGADYWHDPGPYSVDPRYVEVEPISSADPSEHAGAEHFAIISDVYTHRAAVQSGEETARGYGAVQEFSFNAEKVGTSVNPIQPVTHAMTPAGLDSITLPTYGGFGHVVYDNFGDLWGTTSAGFASGATEMFDPAALSGGCAVTGTAYKESVQAFGYPCANTTAVAETMPGSSTSIGSSSALACDCGKGGTGDIIVSSGVWNPNEAYSLPIVHGAGNPPSPSSWTAHPATRLGRGYMRAGSWLLQIINASVDSVRRRLWMPLGSALPAAPEGSEAPPSGGTTEDGVSEIAPPVRSCNLRLFFTPPQCTPIASPNTLIEVNLKTLLGG